MLLFKMKRGHPVYEIASFYVWFTGDTTTLLNMYK
jgi:hypothetical protein